MTRTTDIVDVDLGDRTYPILIGRDLLPALGALIADMLPRKRVFVIADETVARLHGPSLDAGLAEAGIHGVTVLIPPGEGSKSMRMLELVLDQLLAAGAERDDMILAFGGGVVGDLAGLAAGLMKRGAPFIQIPTTLLAQVDSSVGGKTAINMATGKNLVGLFHQPRMVVSDLGLLATLPGRELAAGLAEVAKYALIDDPAFFDWLSAHAASLRRGDLDALGHAVKVSCIAKARIVASDETEQGDRALLNLGHTFGHALERANGFGPELLHGEAVGAGMAMAFRHSVRLGLCDAADATRAEGLLQALGLETRLSRLSGGPYRADELLAHMAHDKKVKDGRMTLILVRGVGKAFIQRGAETAPILDTLSAETAS
jgi:3-dehydroquinate synthase